MTASLNSLAEFISRRGYPQIILSDTGSPFAADFTQIFVASKHVKWYFNLANASWYGGFWERLIGQVKRCLKKLQTKSSFVWKKINLENVRNDFNLENQVELKKYVNHNNLSTYFWNRWRSEYVPSLREYKRFTAEQIILSPVLVTLCRYMKIGNRDKSGY